MNDPAGENAGKTEPPGSEIKSGEEIAPAKLHGDIYWRVVAMIMLITGPLLLAAILPLCSEIYHDEEGAHSIPSRPLLTIGLMVWGTWVATAVIMLQKRVSLKGLIIAALIVGALGALPQMFK